MEGSRLGKTSWKLIAAALVATVALIAFSQPAAASDSLTRSEAQGAAISKVISARDGNFNWFGIEGCRRQGPRVFRCVGIAADDHGIQIKECRFFYTVKKRGDAIRVSVRKRRCEIHPAPLLTRDVALEAVQREGMRWANSGVVVQALNRTGRNSFSATIQWVRKTDEGHESCTIEIGVRLDDRLETSSERLAECEPTDERNNLDNLFQHGPGPKYCPGNAGETWDAKTDLVGKTVTEASAIAAEHGCSVRVVRIDGVGQIITMDLRFNRINVEIEGAEELVVGINGVY